MIPIDPGLGIVPPMTGMNQATLIQLPQAPVPQSHSTKEEFATAPSRKKLILLRLSALPGTRDALEEISQTKENLMGICNASRTKQIRTYQGAFLRDELQKINDACDRFFAQRGVASRRSHSHRRSDSFAMRGSGSHVS
jgi:hypothetical protein